MTQSMTRSLHDVRFPGESEPYRQARNRLLEEELALRRHVEAVAAQRRALPPGGPAPQDYVFTEGDEVRSVRVSQLFGGHQTLIAYSYMFGPAMAQPCPMCTSMLDSLERAARDIDRRASLVVIAKSPIQRIRSLAKDRGWTQFRLLSCAANSYNRDYQGEAADGEQMPVLNVFSNHGGEVRHRYCTELLFTPHEAGQDSRHLDLLWPLWGALDLTPDGRDEFRPRLTYD